MWPMEREKIITPPETVVLPNELRDQLNILSSKEAADYVRKTFKLSKRKIAKIGIAGVAALTLAASMFGLAGCAQSPASAAEKATPTGSKPDATRQATAEEVKAMTATPIPTSTYALPTPALANIEPTLGVVPTIEWTPIKTATAEPTNVPTETSVEIPQLNILKASLNKEIGVKFTDFLKPYDGQTKNSYYFRFISSGELMPGGDIKILTKEGKFLGTGMLPMEVFFVLKDGTVTETIMPQVVVLPNGEIYLRGTHIKGATINDVIKAVPKQPQVFGLGNTRLGATELSSDSVEFLAASYRKYHDNSFLGIPNAYNAMIDEYTTSWVDEWNNFVAGKAPMPVTLARSNDTYRPLSVK